MSLSIAFVSRLFFKIPGVKLKIVPNFNLFNNVVRHRSTIFALSSGSGRCGVSVVRVSGPRSMESLKSIAGFQSPPLPRKAYLRHFKDFKTGNILDRGLVLWFPAPRSFTGEDSVEYQVHGSIAVVRALLSLLGSFPDHRPSQPGEFTKRAFYNEKLDLTQVEGLGDLLRAETEMQRIQAQKTLEGDLSVLYESWSRKLKQISAHVEAFIDFGESETLDFSLGESMTREVKILRENIESHLQDARAGQRLRDGVKIVVLGKPNTGKSTLINYLLQEKFAIVSNTPGTTRDVLRANLNLSGYPVILFDTAGIRSESVDSIEMEGMERALEIAKSADIILLLVDSLDNHLEKIPLPSGPKVIRIQNKMDLKNRSHLSDFIPISMKTHQGLKDLILIVTDEVKKCCTNSSDSPPLIRERYVLHLKNILSSLSKVEIEQDTDITAHYIRIALVEIQRICGKIDPEEILDIIFDDFCIGK